MRKKLEENLVYGNMHMVSTTSRKYGVHVIKNKKILLIGPSESVEKDLEELNDQDFDLIIRINDHYRYKTDNYRTDIIYYAVTEDSINEDDIIYFKENNILLVISKSLKYKRVESFLKLAKKYNYTNYISLRKKIVKEKIRFATTGNYAILNLLTYKFKELHIVGFDFYKTFYFHDKSYSYGDLDDEQIEFVRNKSHPNILEQKYLIKKVVENDKRVFCYGSTKKTLEEIPMITAFVPLRGGSKSIPKKNIKDLNGKPLAQWVIDSARRSKFINNVIISTDSKEIEDSLNNCESFLRSKETATDNATSESALLEFCNGREPNEIIVFLQATSPLLITSEINAGIEKVLNGYDSAVSVVRQKRFIWSLWDGEGHPNYDLDNRPRRQDWEGYLVENGAFYISTVKNILNSKCRVSGKIALIECSEESYYEIDEPSDWHIVEALLNARENK